MLSAREAQNFPRRAFGGAFGARPRSPPAPHVSHARASFLSRRGTEWAHLSEAERTRDTTQHSTERRKQNFHGAATTRKLQATGMMWLFFTAPAAALMPLAQPSSLLARTAEVILRARLRTAASVQVDVDAKPQELLSGGFRGVRVVGADWCTPMRLSCRALDVSVGTARIDFGSLVTKQRILMQTAAVGQASIVFDEADWGNFIVHPLMSEALARYARGQVSPPAVRLAKGATLTPTAATMSIQWDGAPLLATLTQRPGAPATVSVEPACDTAASFMSAFFNSLTIDLDGCELRFSSLSIGPGRSRGSALELSLGLDVCVRRFPSPFVNF